jgi:hypothetical protein
MGVTIVEKWCEVKLGMGVPEVELRGDLHEVVGHLRRLYPELFAVDKAAPCARPGPFDSGGGCLNCGRIHEGPKAVGCDTTGCEVAALHHFCAKHTRDSLRAGPEVIGINASGATFTEVGALVAKALGSFALGKDSATVVIRNMMRQA